MSDVQVPGGDGVLTIYFQNDRPFPASRLGELFGALANDYRRFSGDELLLVAAEDGSLKLTLASLAAVTAIAAGANDLFDFGKNIKEVVSAASAGQRVSAKADRNAGKSAREILETAAASKSRVRLRYRSPNGEELDLDIEPAAVAVARETLARPPRPRRAPSAEPLRRATQTSAAGIEHLEATLDELVARRLAASPEARAAEDQALEVAIRLLVEALRANGGAYAIEDVAQKLEARGLHDVAQMVRRAAGGDGAKETVTP